MDKSKQNPQSSPLVIFIFLEAPNTTTSQAESNGRLSESMEEEESNNKADGSSSKRPLRFYADLPEADLPEVEAFVAILGPHVDKVFVKTGAKEDANRIRVGFF